MTRMLLLYLTLKIMRWPVGLAGMCAMTHMPARAETLKMLHDLVIGLLDILQMEYLDGNGH